MSEKLSRDLVISVFFLSLGSEIAWAVENQFYNDFLYVTLVEIGHPELYSIAITLLVNITTIVGTIATIIMGSYSDVKGKRKPLLLYGFIFWAITTALFPVSAFFSFLGVYFVIFIAITFDSIMTWFGGTAKNAGFNAYVTDVTTLENRSKAIGISQMSVLIALLIVYSALGMLIDIIGYYPFFIIVGVLVGIVGLVGVRKTEEPPDLKPMNINVMEHIRNTFKKKANVDYKNFFTVLLVICAWQTALQVVFPYLLIYLRFTLGSRPQALLIFGAALLIAGILSYPIGKITNKLGRKKMTLISTLCISLGFFLVGISPELLTLLFSGILVFVFYTALSVSTFTWVKDLYPPEGRGQFSGYWNLFSGTIPMIIGPIIGGVICFFQSVPDTDALGRLVLIPPDLIFYVASFLALLTLIPLYFAKEKK
jgi:MFS family permease